VPHISFALAGHQAGSASRHRSGTPSSNRCIASTASGVDLVVAYCDLNCVRPGAALRRTARQPKQSVYFCDVEALQQREIRTDDFNLRRLPLEIRFQTECYSEYFWSRGTYVRFSDVTAMLNRAKCGSSRGGVGASAAARAAHHRSTLDGRKAAETSFRPLGERKEKKGLGHPAPRQGSPTKVEEVSGRWFYLRED
jgi:hypothetical protein